MSQPEPECLRVDVTDLTDEHLTALCREVLAVSIGRDLPPPVAGALGRLAEDAARVAQGRRSA